MCVASSSVRTRDSAGVGSRSDAAEGGEVSSRHEAEFDLSTRQTSVSHTTVLAIKDGGHHPDSIDRMMLNSLRDGYSTFCSTLTSLSHTSRDSAFLFSLFFGMKGICWSILWLSQLPWYKALGVSGARYQMLFLLSISSLSMKGLAGVLSDCFPIKGYHKRPYLIGALVLAFGGFAAIQGMPISFGTVYPEISAFCLFVAGLGIATADLLSETSCAERVAADRIEFAMPPSNVVDDGLQSYVSPSSDCLRSPMAIAPPTLSLDDRPSSAITSNVDPPTPPKDSNRIISFAWLGVTIGWLVSAVTCGPTVDATGDTRWVFRAACILPLLLLFPAVRGALREPRSCIPAGMKRRPWIQMERKTINENKGTLGLAITIPVLTAMISIAGVLLPSSATLVLTWTSAIVLIIFAYRVLPWMLASANVYILLSEALYVSLQGATDFYFTAKPNCVADGPHFSYAWYQGISSIVSTVGCFTALLVFDKFVRHWRIRRAFWVTTILKVCATVFDVMLLLRLNIAIGIPDKIFFLFGDAMLPSLCWLLDYLPGLLLASRLCLKETAATSLAILEAFRFFGTAMSRTSGVFVIDIAGITTKGPDCDFSALPYALIGCHTVLPLLTIPLTFYLLPKGFFADVGVVKIDKEEENLELQEHTMHLQLPPVVTTNTHCGGGGISISPDAPTTLPVSPNRHHEDDVDKEGEVSSP